MTKDAVSIDLKDAYLHVPILSSHRRFLKFIFQGTTYQFKVMPFGLSSAPRVFTKLTRVVILYCRSLGLRIIFYLDDGLLLARPRKVACQQRDVLVGLFLELGWVVNWEKSDLCPSQDFTFVGLHWSSRTMTVTLPQDKMEDLQTRASRMLTALRPPSCRQVQQFLGKANFSSLALPRARLHMRALQADLTKVYSSKKDQFKQCPLSDQARKDLQWWTSPPQNGLPLSPPLPTTTITTDASSTGWGAHWAGAAIAGHWSGPESQLHINCLEMKAATNALKRWGPDLRGQTIALHADNKSMVAYLMKEGGTKSSSLCHLTRDLFSVADRWSITIRPAYLRGVANVEADCLSRGKEVAEWCLLPQVADKIFSIVGVPRWDLFASQESSLAPCYFSVGREASASFRGGRHWDQACMPSPLPSYYPRF